MFKQLVLFLWYIWLIGFLVTVFDVLFFLVDIVYDMISRRIES